MDIKGFFTKRSRRIPLGRMVVYALGSVVLALAVVAGVGEASLRSSHNNFEGGGNEAINETVAVSRLRSLLIDARALGPRIQSGDTEALGDFENISRRISAAYEDLHLLDDEEEVNLCMESQHHWTTSELAASGVWSGGPFRATSYKSHVNHALHYADQLSAVVLGELKSNIEKLDRQTHTTEAIFIVVSLLGLAAGVFFALFFRRSIHGPLRRLEEAATQFSMDNLDHNVKIEREDELGAAAEAFNLMARRLLEGRKALMHQAFHDSLTGLPNRALFQDRAEHALTRTKRNTQAIAVLFVDLDDFKHVNDSLGHSAGDELLLQVATRLRAVTRDEDTVARLGGDEFAVLLEDVNKDSRAAVDAAERITEALKEPVEISGHRVVMNASIGIYTSTSGLDTAEELLRRADVAMYVAKSEGRARYKEFEMSMHEAVSERTRLESDLARALDKNELEVYFQPIVAMETEMPIGAEALLRWIHPGLGMIPPDRFIPVAEQTGQIVPIGRMVLRRAAELSVKMRSEYDAPEELKVSVNLSMRQLQHQGFIEELGEIISDTGCDPSNLVLEITESMLVTNVDNTVTTLRKLRAMGVRVAVDDFGTGYSSLAYLKRFPLDILKIDKSFIDGVASSIKEESALARSIITLAQQMNLLTVAEGIEKPEQVTRLRELGCDHGQGFLFSRPIPASKLLEVIEHLATNGTSELV